MTTQNPNGRKGMLAGLFWPICLETFCMMLAGAADTLMLSSVGDLAVGAVGTANTYINLLIVSFNIASTGMLAVMTQYLGAGQPSVTLQTRRCGLMFNAAMGAVTSLVMVFFSTPILHTIGIAPDIAQPAASYLRIVGGGCMANALIPIFSGHLRAFGRTRQPFVAAIAGNIVNIGLNAYFLYVRHAGIEGVATATVIARCLNLALVAIASHRLCVRTPRGKKSSSRRIIKQILQVGVPSACENVVYSISITIIVSLLNQMDATGFHIAARSYALQISCFAHCASSALGQANAIMTGWHIGAGDFDICSRDTKRVSIIGVVAALAVSGLLAFFAPSYMVFFTRDPLMLQTIQWLLVINILLEAGRAVNVCYGNALKAVGDARFPMLIGVIFMLLCGSGGTWLFGGMFGLAPSAACFIGMCLDECSRAVLMILRWKSGQWKQKVFITNEKTEVDHG